MTQENPCTETERIEALLKEMTLEEQVSILSGVSGEATEPIERLGIPSLRVTDGPHGVGWGVEATCFPTGICMGASWDPELIREVGAALGRETRSYDRHVLLGPCTCIIRTPLGGRNFESFSEDPYHAGRITVGYLQGIQSEQIGTSLKHYACNNQEWERNTIDVEVDERTLREIYLPAFKIGVEEGRPWTVMGAYNRVNGPYCCASKYLLVDILKEEWGYEGVVISDWGATHGTVEFAEGGLDLEMPGPGRYFGDSLVEAVRAGEVSENLVKDKVRRMLRVLSWAGLLDGSADERAGARNNKEHRSLALRLAEGGTVLLKNEGDILPLNLNVVQKIAVIGPHAAKLRLGGGGSSEVKAEHTVTTLGALQSACGGQAEIAYAEGAVLPGDVEPIPVGNVRAVVDGTAQSGLRGEYFDNRELEGEPTVVRLDTNLDFSWANASPVEGVQANSFSVRWTGKLVPNESSRYVLCFSNDQGVRFWFDGELLIDRWQTRGVDVELLEFELEAGKEYDIRIEYHDIFNWAFLKFGWRKVPALIDEAVVLAADSDLVVLCVGTSWHSEGEGHDRTELELPGCQEELIRKVVEVNKNCVVVLTSGTAVAMDPWVDSVPAVIDTWYPGQEGGTAVANVLLGKSNPSGKLPMTFPKRLEDNPSHGNYPGTGGVVEYAEGLYVGYRHYDARDIEPLFPFGHGLSYTTFEYSDLSIEEEVGDDGSVWQVTCRIRNSGSRDGSEVVQLYVSDSESRLDRPEKELKEFCKIHLKSGEEKEVSFDLEESALSYYDPDAGRWIAEPGEFVVRLGSSSRDIRLEAKFNHGG